MLPYNVIPNTLYKIYNKFAKFLLKSSGLTTCLFSMFYNITTVFYNYKHFLTFLFYLFHSSLSVIYCGFIANKEEACLPPSRCVNFKKYGRYVHGSLYPTTEKASGRSFSPRKNRSKKATIPLWKGRNRPLTTNLPARLQIRTLSIWDTGVGPKCDFFAGSTQ